MLYELAKAKSIQDKLRSEIINAGDRTFDVINEMSYLDQCINGNNYYNMQ